MSASVEEIKANNEDVVSNTKQRPSSFSSLDHNVEKELTKFASKESVVYVADSRPNDEEIALESSIYSREDEMSSPVSGKEPHVNFLDEESRQEGNVLDSQSDAEGEDNEEKGQEEDVEGEEVVKQEGVEIQAQSEEAQISAEQKPKHVTLIAETDSQAKKTRKSVFSKQAQRRLSIKYPEGPRIPDDVPERKLSGDFTMPETRDFFDTGPDFLWDTLSDVEHFVEEEEEISEDKDESPQPIDRTPYYERYPELVKSIKHETLKNKFLERKLVEYFKRRKMEQALKGPEEESYEVMKKYRRQLDAFQELIEYDANQRTNLNVEIDSLKKIRDKNNKDKMNLFQHLQAREKEIGTGLINTKTGKPIPDKVVEKALFRQKNSQQKISEMRLKHIKLRNKVTDLQEKIKALEVIEGNLSLMDYETLKIKNRSYIEKLEERDEELDRLRGQCQSSIQILAHYREKSNATDSDIQGLTDTLGEAELDVNQARETMNSMKQERDYYRAITNNIREDSGLLTKTELLYDMEESMKELEEQSTILKEMEEQIALKKVQVKNIRKHIAKQSEVCKKKYELKQIKKRGSVPKLAKGRPALIKPILPVDAFEDLKNLPKPTYCFRKKKK